MTLCEARLPSRSTSFTEFPLAAAVGCVKYVLIPLHSGSNLSSAYDFWSVEWYARLETTTLYSPNAKRHYTHQTNEQT